MNELLKFAQENQLTEEDLGYLFEQGLEKVASDYQDEVLYDAFEKVAAAYDVTPEELDYLVQAGHEKVTSVQDEASLTNEEKLRLVEGLQRSRQAIPAAEEVEKTASADFTEEEIEYIIAQGLEKVASDLEQ